MLRISLKKHLTVDVGGSDVRCKMLQREGLRGCNVRLERLQREA